MEQVKVSVNKRGFRSQTGPNIDFALDGDNSDWYNDSDAFDYDYDVEYIMTPTGLERVKGQPSNDESEDPETLKTV